MCHKTRTHRHRHPRVPSTDISTKLNDVPENVCESTTKSVFQPPCFTIDLSKHPQERYTEACGYFNKVLGPKTLHRMLLDMLSEGCKALWLPKGLLWMAIHLGLRHVYDSEEQAELHGIAKAMDVPVYLLVALNVMVDMMMACSTSSIRTTHGNAENEKAARSDQTSKNCEESSTNETLADDSSLLHLRIMDWNMPLLRRLVVELTFLRKHGGPVIATSMSYLGYVGVFTGVRSGLSMSINFRAKHGHNTVLEGAAYRKHQLLVMLGRRRSVASYIRHCLLTPDAELDGKEAFKETVASGSRKKTKLPITTPILDFIVNSLPKKPSTSVYLMFCTPQVSYLLEKDHRQANVFEDNTILTVCNHDQEDGLGRERKTPINKMVIVMEEGSVGEKDVEGADEKAYPVDGTVDDLLELAALAAKGHRGLFEYFGLSIGRHNTLVKLRDQALAAKAREEPQGKPNAAHAVDFQDVVDMVQHRNICHHDTHYVAIMDPAMGEIVWRRAYH